MGNFSGPLQRPVAGLLGNAIAMIIAGGSGLVLLVAIAVLHGAATLGRFNLLFTVYLAASQMATLGLHVAAVRFTAPVASDPIRRASAVQGSLLSVLIAGGVTTLGLFVAGDLLATLLGRPDLGPSLRLLAPGVLVFAVNKVLLAVLTAVGRMRAHAGLVGLRGVGMLVLLGLFQIADLPADDLFLILPMTEVALLVPLLFILRAELGPSRWTTGGIRDVAEFLRFGVLGAGSSLLTEINIRIDVLVLALFVNDGLIGVYTLAAVLAEAVLQFPIVHRTVMAPTVARLVVARRVEELHRLVVHTRGRVAARTALVAAASMLALPLASAALGFAGDFEEAGALLLILSIGVVVASAYVPFNLVLAHAGRPLAQSGFVLAVAALNLTGNLLLVPRFGLSGAAGATALANVLSVPMLRWSARRVGLEL